MEHGHDTSGLSEVQHHDSNGDDVPGDPQTVAFDTKNRK